MPPEHALFDTFAPSGRRVHGSVHGGWADGGVLNVDGRGEPMDSLKTSEDQWAA